jgi:myo-inositol-1(or 4)-monophosphatase
MPGEPPRELVVGLARSLRELIAPELGDHGGRAHAGAAEGGDVTFAIDERAEAHAEGYLAERAPAVALYSEDRGLVAPDGDPAWVLVVDPIDGTRPAMAGLEAACVSVAAAALDPEREAAQGEGAAGRGDSGPSARSSYSGPTMGDVAIGCIVEIKSGREFLAVRGAGVDPDPRLSGNDEISRMFWTYGFRGRPARAIAAAIGDLIDASSVGGGTFELGSACFDMTRIVTGQLDAYIEVGPRLVEEVPGMRAEFERVGGGAVLNNSPYDVAAAVLCLEEAGAVITDAAGRSLADRPLLGSGPEFQMSCLAASNQALHEKLLREVDLSISRLKGRSG